LGETGLAILYYYRAVDLLPRNKDVENNLKIALKTVGQTTVPNKTVFDYIFFFRHLFSFEELEIALLGAILFAFCFCSFCIWLPYAIFRFFVVLALASVAILGMHVIWLQFFAPLQAVIIHPASLRSGDEATYVPVTTVPPLGRGLKVDVLEVRDNGAWLRIKLPSGEEGFVAKDQIRII
jgi:hypothetical protein